jgi:hypothetical protein
VEIENLYAGVASDAHRAHCIRDVAALSLCDAIALLPGWEESIGARAEKACAEWMGLTAIFVGHGGIEEMMS